MGDASGRTLYGAGAYGTCHDRNKPGVPWLTAQQAGYLAKQMTDFREGRRGSLADCIPQGAAGMADDGEIAAVAAYLSSVARR